MGEIPTTQEAYEGFPSYREKEILMADKNMQETLDRILDGLKSDTTEQQLAAIHNLERIHYSSEAIQTELEKLSLRAEGAVQKFALTALSLRTSQFVAEKRSKISKPNRLLLLREIEKWQASGLIEAHRAEILRRRYDFDLKPATSPRKPAQPKAETKPAEPIPQPEPTALAPASVPPAPPQKVEPPFTAQPRPAGPRPSLAQTLLSETSVRIYLYLGAFFVIASAAILAALVEAVRLPILLVATATFASGAVGFKKRLPQPSFAFAIVFSFLLPIDAGVIADLLNISGRVGDVFWTFILSLMAVIWIFGTWFYESRLFSLAAFVAVALGALRFVNALNLRDDWIVFALGASGLMGLIGMRFLKNWKDQKFAQPLFLAAQLLQMVNLLVSFTQIGLDLLNGENTVSGWIAHTLTWLFAAAFFAASDLLIPFFLFPWLGTASLFLVPWLFLSAFEASPASHIAGFVLWGALIALASEFVYRSQAVRKYHYPLLFESLPLFFIALLWGFVDDVQYGFAALLLAGISYTAVNILRPRWYVWFAALLFGLGAYFTFFALPFMQRAEVYFGYQVLIASLFLLVPELFSRQPLLFTRLWNWPPVALGTFVTTFGLLFAFAFALQSREYHLESSVILGVYMLLFAAFALHFQQPLIGYLATPAAAFSIVFGLSHFALDLWLPALTAFSCALYAAGFFLHRREGAGRWGSMLVNSGLALGAILTSVAVFMLETAGGWYVLVVAALFTVEMFTRRKGYWELFIEPVLSVALILFLNDLKVSELPYYFFGVSLVWLGSDAFLHLRFAERTLGLITRWIGALATLLAIAGISVNNGLASAPAGTCYAVYAIFFAAYAWLYKKPVLGYLSTASAAVTLYYVLDHFNVAAWLPLFTALAVGCFGTGFLIRKKDSGWSEMFRYSGLGLGSLVAFVALVNVEATGGWYAAIIGLLFAVETGSSRNGWFEAGVHLLFSVAAFLILADFQIREYSYILLALSLVWLGGDLAFHKLFQGRKLHLPVRLIGAGLSALNAGLLPLGDSFEAAVCFGVYAPFFALQALSYRKPLIGYASTGVLPLAVFFALRAGDLPGWSFYIVAIAVLYYAAGFILRRAGRVPGWDRLLLTSGLGVGTITALLTLFQAGEVEKAIPIAVAATLFAVEAFDRRDVRLAFPANGLYLAAYFTALVELDVNEPQYFSVGAALLGMLMNYLLRRAGSETGAFLMGMLSQLVLLGTTYIQMVALLNLGFFFILFLQSLVVLAYGILMRSRSLTLAPIGFAVLGVVTIMYYALKDLSLVVIIGITGLVLLTLGILAVVMRERITTLAERFSDWNA